MTTRVRKAQPDASTWNLYPELGRISVAFMQEDDDFVAPWFFPFVSVQEATGKYAVFNRSHFGRNGMAKRSDGERSAQGGYEVTYAQFLCEVWAEHCKQGQQVRKNAKLVDLDQAAIAFLTEQSKISLEVEFLSTYFTTSIWTGDLTGDATPSGDDQFLSWADDDAQPIVDLKKAIRRVRINGGKKPNKGIFTEPVWDRFSQHPNVISLVNAGQTTGMAQVTPEAVAAYLGLKGGIKIAGATYTTSAEGTAEASATHDYIADDGVLLGYVEPAPGIMKPTAGYHFGWETYLEGSSNQYGAAFRRWFEEGPNAHFYEVEQARDMHQVAPGLACFLATPLAT